MSKWVKWFASYLFTSAKDPQQFSENLALSLATVDPTDVWCLIESEEDEKFSLQSQKERQARETELQQMKGFMARSPSQQDWLKKFAELLLTVPSDDQHIVLSSLPSDMRVSIINRIVKTRGQQWLDVVEKLYMTTHTRSKENPINFAPLEELKASWFETQYAKNRLGALRDFTMLSYTEGRLTPNLLSAIHLSLLNSFKVIFRIQLKTDLTGDDVLVLEDLAALSIPDIVALHVQAAQNYNKAQSNEGKLPTKWKAQDAEHAEKLVAIKAKGVDAKWVEPVPYSIRENRDERVSKNDLEFATRVLRNMLRERNPQLEEKGKEKVKEEEDENKADAPDLNALVIGQYDAGVHNKLNKIMRVEVTQSERMDAEAMQHRRLYLMHNMFSPKHLKK